MGFDQSATDEIDGQDISPASVSTDDTNSERIAGDRHYAGEYDGASPNERLGNALTAASDGDAILLENTAYGTDRTILTQVTLLGSAGHTNGTTINANWTLGSQFITLERLSALSSASLTVNKSSCSVINCFNSTAFSITVDGDRFRYIANRGGDVTFQVGSKDGIVDACSQTTVTDNDGGNVTGDIA